MEKIIPIVTCFNNNYSIPAGVCFYSLLKNANRSYNYKLYVLENDITDENKAKLNETVKDFSNAEIEFIEMNNRFEELFEKIKCKSFYTKEMFYKFCIPSLFPQYEKIIVTDVDVCFLGDVSEEFVSIDLKDAYMGAFKTFLLKNSLIDNFLQSYKKNFSEAEQQAAQYAGGYYIFNLEKMRADNMENKFTDYAQKNYKKIVQPEQDSINISCYPYIKDLKPNSLVCTYIYDMYKTQEDFDSDLNYSAEEIKYAMENPVQLHYATGIKPWNSTNCIKSEIWYNYLKETPFYTDFIKTIISDKKYAKEKKFASLKIKKHYLDLVWRKKI